jgi:hypothetical protein
MRPSLVYPVGLVAPSSLPGPGRLVISPEGRLPSFEQPTVPLPVGGRGDEPALVVLIIDESPSEHGLDPHSYRHVAGRRTLALLRDDLPHPGDRLACVHFATRPRPWLGPTSPHTGAGYEALRQVLRPVGASGGTDIRPALELAARLIPRHWPGPVAVILLSDGQDASTMEQLTAAVERFPPGAVHVISIGSALPGTWNDVPLGSSTAIPSLVRPDEVEWATARVVYQAVELEWPGPEQPPGAW